MSATATNAAAVYLRISSAVAFDTDAPTTIRHSIAELQLLGEVPNAIALNPVDAEGIDLTRRGASGGFLTGGYQNDTRQRVWYQLEHLWSQQ